MHTLNQLNELIKGNKTYGLASLAILVVLAKANGYVDDESATAILYILGFGSVITLRNGITTENNK